MAEVKDPNLSPAQLANQTANSRLFLLRPSVREHVLLFPQQYRGENWYVLYDRTAGRYMRFDARVYQIIGRMDGVLTLEEIIEQVNQLNDYDPFTREEFMELIAQLDAAELLSGGLPVDVDVSYKRLQDKKKKSRQKSLMNPLSIKLKLVNPENMLDALTPLGNFLFSKLGLIVWALFVFTGIALSIANYSQLSNQVAQMTLSPWQMGIIWVVYPIIKLFHEIGHGLAIKKWGGNVREAGVNLLIFLPVPYVDATASWAFRNKWKRISVGAAGIMTELFIAALALFLWVLVEPGLFQEVLLNIILIAAVSTVLFNGNPLLRFDGYFILEDWLEIPNLATRAKQYYYYLFQNYILKLEDRNSPVTADGERFWFVLYGLVSPLYRIVIMLVVAFYLAEHYLFAGVIIAIWVLLTQLISPIYSAVVYLLFNDDLVAYRKRSLVIVGSTVLTLLLVLAVPLPLVTSTQGVITGDGDNNVVAESTGFISFVVTQPGEEVKKNQLLLRIHDDELSTDKEILTQKRRGLVIELNEVRHTDRVKSNDIRDDLRALDSQLIQLANDQKNTLVMSNTEGVFLSSKPGLELKGLFVEKGELLGQVINTERLVVKAVVSQAHIGLLKTERPEIEIIPASNLNVKLDAKIVNETPKAQFKIEYKALTTQGGGDLVVQQANTELLKTPVFLVDLAFDVKQFNPVIGERVYVRFNHGVAPLGYQISLMLHQLFLKYLGKSEE